MLKYATKEVLEEGITAAWRGRIFMSAKVSEGMTSSVAKSAPLPMLTTREKEVLVHIAEGMTNQEIASKLFFKA